MTQMTRTVTLLTAVLTAVALFAATLAARPAGAVVPPKDCGKITVSGKRYGVKAQHLKCTTAREYSARYLRSRTKPRYYSCFTYTGSKIKFRCAAARYSPDREFYAIKR